MIDIYYADSFVTTPWKNGLGETTELAISEQGTLSDFDWRLSIATVSQDGAFSDFSGIRRDLFLIDGNGIKLSHELNGVTKLDTLSSILDYSTFDGASTTIGNLLDGTIKDLNLMTRKGMFAVNIDTYVEETKDILIEHTDDETVTTFIIKPPRSLILDDNSPLVVQSQQSESFNVEQGALIKLTGLERVSVSGCRFIVISLTR